MPRTGRGKKEQRTGRTNQKAEKDAAFVTNFVHHAATGKSGEKVAAEKCDLDEGRLEVREIEQFLEVRYENVIEVHADGPEEEEARDQSER